YMLISTVIVFAAGSAAFLRADEVTLWAVQVLVMVAFSVLLFTWMVGGRRRSIHLMLLVGIVLGTFFRAFTEWSPRIVDPRALRPRRPRLDAAAAGPARLPGPARPDVRVAHPPRPDAAVAHGGPRRARRAGRPAADPDPRRPEPRRADRRRSRGRAPPGRH